MSGLTQLILQITLIVLIGLVIPCVHRMVIGPSAADRLQAIDTITTLLIGMMLVLAAIRQDWMFVDVAIALAALGFIGTLALARYISEGKLF